MVPIPPRTPGFTVDAAPMREPGRANDGDPMTMHRRESSGRRHQRVAIPALVLLSTLPLGCLEERRSAAELAATLTGQGADADGLVDDGALRADAAQDEDGVDAADTGGGESDTLGTDVADAAEADAAVADAGDVDGAGPDAADHDGVGSDAAVSDAADTDGAASDADVADGAGADAGDADVDGAGADAADSDTTPGQVCTPGVKGCVGNVTSVCVEDGSKVVPVVDCETLGLLCSAGACVAKQQGFAGGGSFGGLAVAAGAGYRVSELRFGVQRTCKGGFCAVGGIRP